MFCTSLRRRPSYSSIIPTLTSTSTLGLYESKLDTHDIAIPLDANIDPSLRSKRHLRLLLLSPSAVSNDRLKITLERIDHFSMSSQDAIAIVFLLAPPHETNFHAANAQDHPQDHANTSDQEAGVPGILAYSTLQAELLNHAFPSIPILPLTRLEGLPQLLNSHVIALTTPPARTTSAATTSYELLGQCTLHPPMGEDTHFYLSDTFGNLRDVASVMTTVQRPAQRSSSPRTGDASSQKYSMQSQPRWPEDGPGELQLSSDEESPKGKLSKLGDVIGGDEIKGLKDFWEGEYEIQ